MPGHRESKDRELFDGISDVYAAKDLASSSRPARRWRLERTLRTVPRKHFRRVLEVGCGAGFAAAYLRGRYEHYTGIDHSRGLIEAATERNGGDGIHFESISVDDFKPEFRFDLIVMIGVVHHLANPADALSRIARWLAPGGYLVANEPQPANPLIRRARKFRARVDGSYSSEQVELSANQLHTLFFGAGLKDVEITPQGLFSTPFAEVVLRPQILFSPLVHTACAVDAVLEFAPAFWLRKLSWNLVASGRSSEMDGGPSPKDLEPIL